jgi:hypothetical protein
MEAEFNYKYNPSWFGKSASIILIKCDIGVNPSPSMTWSSCPDPASFVVHWAMMECGNGPLPRPSFLPFTFARNAQMGGAIPLCQTRHSPLEYARPAPIPSTNFVCFFAFNWHWLLAIRSFGWAHPFPSPAAVYFIFITTVLVRDGRKGINQF